MLTAILVALQLSACGGDSSATETAGTGSAAESSNEASAEAGVDPTEWDEVNDDLRGDILSFGHKGTEAELEGATVVLRAYLAARANESYSEVCSYLSEFMLAVAKGTARRRDGGGCPAGVESLANVSSSGEAKGPLQIDPSSIRRGNKRTFVIYEGDEEGTYAMLMRREGDAWKIHGFEPTRIL
ncbi:MAG TPA: hypothetical protein VF093_06010 [Solirubrobacterales bacterium]